MGVCGNICCVAPVVKVCCMFVFSLCIVRRGAVGARVWEAQVFRPADVVCLCLVYILWQFSMLRSA